MKVKQLLAESNIDFQKATVKSFCQCSGKWSQVRLNALEQYLRRRASAPEDSSAYGRTGGRLARSELASDSAESVKCAVRVVQSIEQKVEKKRPTTKRWVWVTTMSSRFASTKTVWRIGQARWDIENRFLNEVVNQQYDLDRAYKHHPTAILVMVLTLATALTLVNAFSSPSPLKPTRLEYQSRSGNHQNQPGIAIATLLSTTSDSSAPETAAGCISPPPDNSLLRNR